MPKLLTCTVCYKTLAPTDLDGRCMRCRTIALICHTSIDYAQRAIRAATDPDVLRECIHEEEDSYAPRKTLIKQLQGRIRAIKRQRAAHERRAK